jgi:hypothetical protein
VQEDRDGGYPLKEISLSEAIERGADLAYCGQRVYLGFQKHPYLEDATVPKKEVKKYPVLKGSKPLYGTVRFDHSFLKPESGREYHFVIDATGDAGYDRLHFDVNRDLDLSNDRPVGLSKKPWPEKLWPRSAYKDRMFEELSVPIDFGPGYGVRPVKILPLLMKYNDEAGEPSGAGVFFVNLSFRAGRIKIGDKELDAVLAQNHSVSGRFDRPGTALYLMAPGKKEPLERWWGAEVLGAYRLVDGKYYTISTTAVGDRLFVKPYTGDLGVFEAGPGSRGIKDITVRGSLFSPDRSVGIGTTDKEGYPEAVAEWEVPAGEYAANYINVTYGPLRITISNNYHSDGKRQDSDRQPKFAMRIEKDKPFVLDFSNKPEVMFASPAKQSVFKPGSTVEVNAVLIDAVLDIMIRGLIDTRQKVKEVIDQGDPGLERKVTREKDKSLDPVVTIADSSGKTVAEGTMPFG